MHENNWPAYQAAQKAARILNQAGFEAYVIGGAARDLLLGKTPKDFDLTTNATPEDILKLDGFDRSTYQDTSQAYGITRVVLAVDTEEGQQTVELEIATYRRDVGAHRGRKDTEVEFSTLEEDIKRRDFTINALAFDPNTNQLIDRIGGIEDIQNKRLRFIGDPFERIQEDPLRIIRAVRLKNQLGFDYEQDTRTALTSDKTSQAAKKIATERLKRELTSILMHPSRKAALEDLDAFGFLEVILPEVAATKGVPQPKHLHAEGDVFVHTLLTLDRLPDIISPRLAWAALLHDIGKTSTYQPAETTEERIRFSGHHQQGAATARDILTRLHFQSRFCEEVAWMIHYHMGIDDLPSMRPRRADRFMHHPAFADLLELHKADAHAAWSIDEDGRIDDGPADFSALERMWTEFQRRQHQHPPSLKRDLGIDGAWIMDHFDVAKGPQLGKLLTLLEEAYLNHEINDEASAHKYTMMLIQQGLDDESSSTAP